ncbi:hypothetical protein [Sphingobium sp. CCH11-B1]|jgi:hypothetical protein|uniref:hypothetical protein n=1 Tax=Sphingobium sp. CCH11-B1 TaxID=1768781 RepID=UPI00082C0195|nr:hypothetical protein [Sphingobium sp. CCH11-B1]MEA3388368.1 hypothetical protein [Pseudomonadota bacterium]
MRKIALLTLAGALALSACGKKAEEAPATNNMVEPPVENVIIDEPDAPIAEPQNNAAATPPAPPPSVSEQQQIQDDAEATGMTARLPEGGESSQPADESSTKGE